MVKSTVFGYFCLMLMETRLGGVLKRAALLDEGQAWIESITPELQQQYLEKWIKGDQLFNKGIDEDGDVLGTYSYMTQILSGGRKKAGTNYTLLDSGQFYRSIYIKVFRDVMLVDGDFNKMLDKNWWNINNLEESKILGLNDENLEKFIAQVAIGYAEYFRRILGFG